MSFSNFDMNHKPSNAQRKIVKNNDSMHTPFSSSSSSSSAPAVSAALPADGALGWHKSLGTLSDGIVQYQKNVNLLATLAASEMSPEVEMQ